MHGVCFDCAEAMEFNMRLVNYDSDEEKLSVRLRRVETWMLSHHPSPPPRRVTPIEEATLRRVARIKEVPTRRLAPIEEAPQSQEVSFEAPPPPPRREVTFEAPPPPPRREVTFEVHPSPSPQQDNCSYLVYNRDRNYYPPVVGSDIYPIPDGVYCGFCHRQACSWIKERGARGAWYRFCELPDQRND